MAEVALTPVEATMAVTVVEEVDGLAAMAEEAEAEAEMAAAVEVEVEEAVGEEVEGVADEEEVKWIKW